jgi:hypothetical protein
VWGLLRMPEGAWLNSLLFESGHAISSFGEDARGAVYLVDYAGAVFRLTPAG